MLSLRRADHLSRGVLSTVVRRYVLSRNLMNERALTHWGGGLLRQKKKTLTSTQLYPVHVNEDVGLCHVELRVTL